jgi:protoporphyrinogen oxidase
VTTFDCVIVGGGFTGLSAALEITASGRSCVIFESDDAVGGLASGFDVGGYELEKFYHHWFTSDHHITDVVRQIGKSDQIVTRPSKTGMYFSGDFYRLSTPLDLLRFRALPFLDRIRTGIATLSLRGIKDWKKLESVTAKSWLESTFGRTSYKVLWEPLLVGKFGEYADEVSAVWFWKKLALRGASRGKQGGEQLAYYLGGFAQLARDIAARVAAQGGEIRTATRVLSIQPGEAGQLEVKTASGTVSARTVLITTPLPIAADLLENAVPAEFSMQLRRVRYLSNVCLILSLDRSLSETYWLNVNDPSFPFVGIIEHTNFEPPESYGGKHIVFLSRYLPPSEAVYRMSADELLEYAIPHIQAMFPAFDRTWINAHYVWKADYAQPIVERHYSKYVPGFDTPLQGVKIATMAQVYPEDRGTNYAVREGFASAKRILSSLSAID